MAFNVGINVIETEGNSTPAIAGAPTSVTGFVIRSARGPTGSPVRVSGMTQFVSRFGGFDARYDGAYCIDGYFKNGGREAWVTRVLGDGSDAASVTLPGRTGGDSLLVSAGYRGSEDHGSWGNGLSVRIADSPRFSTALVADRTGDQPARLQSGAWAGTTVDLSTSDGSSRVLGVAVDGGAVMNVTLDATTLPVVDQATAADVVEAIEAVAGSQVAAAPAAGGLLLISRSKGAGAAVAVSAADDTATVLGFDTGNTAAAGVDGTGTYTEAQVASISGIAVGAIVRLDDGITSDWRTVTAVEIRDDGSGGEESFVVWTEPPAPERNEYLVADEATISTCEFDVVIGRDEPGESEPVVVETFAKVSLDPDDARYGPLVINDPFSGSGFVTIEDLNAAYAGTDVPATGSAVQLGVATPDTTALVRTVGADGDPPTTADYRSAFPLYDTIDIQLLTVPETMADGILTAVTRAGLDYASGPTKGDCIYAGFTPADRDAAGAKAFGQGFQASKVYGAMYWPWVTVIDPAGTGANPVRTIPPVGHVLGVYARVDQTRGVWKAPAGNEATVKGVLSVERAINDIDHTDLVKNGSVNAIRSLRGTGIVIDSSRSLSTDSRWLYINVRLLFNYVKASLRDGLRWVKQEPNREDLWNKVKFNAISPFLLRLYQQGAFGPGTPDQVFTVVCDASNNPPDQIELGFLKVEVYFYPSRPAETIIIMVGQQEGVSTANDA